MKNITLAVDERLLAEARVVAAENRTTVNALVRAHLEQVVARRSLSRMLDAAASVHRRGRAGAERDDSVEAPQETTHQRMQRLLNEGRAKYADRDWFDREYTYDRDYQRAEAYFENRAALLKLIDESTADMGKQKWNREALYDR
jgi:hypothetical protein